MTRPMLIARTGFVLVMGIRFHPGGTLPFFRTRMNELTNCTVELRDLAADLDCELFERAGQEQSLLQKLKAVERFLIARVRNSRQESWVLDLAAKIVKDSGVCSVDTLASSVGVSARQLERKFLREVGIGPKLLCRILRFQRIFRSLQENNVAWAAVAADCGYFDQAHLIRDFKQFAQQTPSVYLEHPGALTEAFTRRDRMSLSSNTRVGN